MVRLPKRYLLLSSICVIACLASCHLSSYQNLQNTKIEVLNEQHMRPVVNPDGISSKFKAGIDVLNQHLSGIVVVKKTDSVTTHIVFVTELGMKMFALEQTDTSLNMVYVFEPLNKPKLINALKTDFKNMLLLDVFGVPMTLGVNKKQQSIYELVHGRQKRYFLVTENNKLLIQETFYKSKKTSKIMYVYDVDKSAYTQINSVRYGLVKIKIELNKITQ